MSLTGTPGVGTVMLAIPSKKVRYYAHRSSLSSFLLFFLDEGTLRLFVCLFVCARARAGKRIGKAPSITDTERTSLSPSVLHSFSRTRGNTQHLG